MNFRVARRILLPALALAVTFAAPAAAGRGAKAVPKTKLSVPIIKTEDIRPGMKGYGLTTFKGTKPEKFDVEVVDVLLKALPKHDLILVKCTHPVIEQSSVISGMSGSPIYIEDKLAGALAYAWSFSKEPIAGVTPIEWMLKEMDEPAQKPAEGGSVRRMSLDVEEKQEEPAPLQQGLTRMRLPVYLSGLAGLPARATNRLRAEFEKRGLVLMQGTGGSKAAENIGQEALVAGAPMGISLMRGDISFTGIGTVTHREGNRIIGFGHPMMMTGEQLPMPITTAYVHGVMPSQWMSFKFSSPSRSVGTLTQDKLSSVAGTIGKECPMIAVTGTMVNDETGREESISVELIKSRTMTPYLLMLTSAYLLVLDGGSDTDCAVNYALDMEFEEEEKLHLEGMDMAYGGIYMYEPAYAMDELMNNSFEPLKPKKVSLRLQSVHKRIDARIQRAWLDQLEARPGTQVILHLRLQPYNGAPKEITFPIQIPPHLDEGKYDIVVGGGSSWAVQQPTPPAESVKDIFTQLKMRYRPTTAVALLKLPSVGVGFKGRLFRQLPSSVFGTLVSSSSAGVSTFQDGIRFTHETDWYLTGETQRLKIIVKQSAEETE